MHEHTSILAYKYIECTEGNTSVPQQRGSGNEGVGGVETSLYPLHNLGMLNHTEVLLSQETLIFKIFIKVIDAHV